MDTAHDWTDKELEKLERRITKEYKQAAKEMREKQEKALKEYAQEREQRLKALDNTKESKAAYKAWLNEQANKQAWLQSMTSQLADQATRTNEIARNTINSTLPRIYAENANMAAYAIDKQLRADTAFTLVDQDTVRNLMKNKNKPILREVPNSKRVRKADYRWNRRKFTSVITQSILQGESIPDIVKRAAVIFGSNRAAAIRAARTATTSAENAGRQSSYERATSLGVELYVEWVASIDDRTRWSHVQLDGQQVEVGEPFKAEGGDLAYPGDPSGAPEEVYNCRCTTRGRVKGFEHEQSERWSNLPPGIEYEDWKAGKLANSR